MRIRRRVSPSGRFWGNVARQTEDYMNQKAAPKHDPGVIEVFDDRFPERFFLVQSALMRGGYAKAIGPSATLVYLCLADHANRDGSSFPSIGRIAEQVGLTERPVRSALRVLEAHGIVTTIQVRGRPNIYRLTAPSNWRLEADGTSPNTPAAGSRPPKVLDRLPAAPEVEASRLSPSSINDADPGFLAKDVSAEKKNGTDVPTMHSPEKRPPTPLWSFWEAFCRGAGIDPNTQPLLGNQLNVAKAIMKDGITEAEIEACGAAMRKTYRPVLTMQYARGFLPGFLAEHKSRSTKPDDAALLRWNDHVERHGKYPPDALDYFKARWNWDRPNANHPEFIDEIKVPTAKLVNRRGEQRLIALAAQEDHHT